MSEERAAAIAAWRKELELTLVLARNATNGWACYAKRQIEHDEIARLHNAISEVERRLSALPATEGAWHQPKMTTSDRPATERERAKKKPRGYLRCPWCRDCWETDIPRDGWDHCPLCKGSFSFRKPSPEAAILQECAK